MIGQCENSKLQVDLRIDNELLSKYLTIDKKKIEMCY